MPALPARLIDQIHRLAAPADACDADLLDRYVCGRDEAAFAALVQRHGPMVHRLCQRLVDDAHAAEDAFQATFLILARRAGSIRRRGSLAAWLYGTARRVCFRARTSARRTSVSAREAIADRRRDPLSEVSAREVLRIVDEEVQRLPEAQRLAVVLCGLDGQTVEEAARQLGCTVGALRGWLQRGRKRLHNRLVRRGITLSAALSVTLAAHAATAACAVPTRLASATLAAAWAIAGGTDGAHAISADAARLAAESLSGTGLAKTKLACLAVLVLGLTLGGAGSLAPSSQERQGPRADAGAQPAALPKAERRLDAHGDPMPAGALNRLGTVQQRAPDSKIAVTADGKEIVAVNADLVIRRFDADTGALRSTTRLPRSPSRWPVWLSPRGSYALTVERGGDLDVALELWDLAQRKRVQTLPLGKNADPWRAAFSADEQRVAIADSSSSQRSHRVRVWDWATGKSRVIWSLDKEIYERFYDPVVVLSNDGKLVAASHLDQQLRCWDADSGKLLWEASKRHCFLLCFQPDGKALLTNSTTGRPGFAAWDAESGRLTETNLPKGADYLAGITPDGRLLAFESGFGELLLWERGAAQPVARLPAPQPRGKSHFVPNRMIDNLTFTPDSRSAVRRAGSLGRWLVDGGKLATTDTADWGHTEEVTRLVFSPDGRLLASAANDQTVRMWDLAKGACLHVLPRGLSAHLAFTPDGRQILATPADLGPVVLNQWDVQTGKAAAGFALADTTDFMTGSGTHEIRITADASRVLTLTWKNGRIGDESILTAWKLAGGACVDHRRVPWAEDSVLLPDGERVLAADSRTGAVRVLAIDTGKELLAFATDLPRGENDYRVCRLAVSPDGRLMAARAQRQELRSGKLDYGPILVGDLATGRPLTKIAAKPAAAQFAFSADSRMLAIAQAAEVRLWEAASGKEVARIAVGSADADLRALAISPDGRTLATGHADSTILLWDATGQRGTAPGRLTATQAEACWTALAGDDAPRAYAAIWQLAAAPPQALPMLHERVRAVEASPTEHVRKLLLGLDSADFTARQAAERGLQELGERVEPALRQALKQRSALESQRRIEQLLAALQGSAPLEGEPLRAMRSVQVLEAIGTPEARSMLQSLARGVPTARLTRAAAAALERLNHRRGAFPG
jgi:RNA polymerase sigma factor (sigma-70 family)